MSRLPKTKKCGHCKKTLPLSDFNRSKAKNHGLHYQSWCRDCYRERNYGLAHGEWDKIFESQGQMCAICKTSVPNSRGWAMDHNHVTNNYRGILCDNCNKLLGHAKDSPQILENAITYLLAFK